MSLKEMNTKKLTLDLVVGLDSGLEDLVNLLEKGKTELYYLESIISFFVKKRISRSCDNFAEGFGGLKW